MQPLEAVFGDRQGIDNALSTSESEYLGNDVLSVLGLLFVPSVALYLLLETARRVVVVVHPALIRATPAQVEVVGVQLRRRGSVRGGRAFIAVRTEWERVGRRVSDTCLHGITALLREHQKVVLKVRDSHLSPRPKRTV